MFEKDGDGMKRLIKGIVCVVLLIGIIGSGLLIYQGHSAYKELVSEHPLQEQVEEIQKREDYTSLDEISPYLIDATISVEDKNFYSHNGVDIAGVARAVLSNLFGIGDPSGGSTISQQLCKNLYVLFYDTSITRKITEAFLTYELEGAYEKDEILELYFNVINYGDGYIGIRAASQGYFGKEPKELTLDEASLLAGIPQSPNNFQLSDHLENAKEKQEIVLEAMLRENKISEAQMQEITGDS